MTELFQEFMRNYEQYVNDAPNDDEDVCRDNLRRMAYVHFQLAGQTVTQIKRELRVTFTDHVSSFGKL